MGDRPNIILIMTDDQGPWALGCAGTPELRIPSPTGKNCATIFSGLSPFKEVRVLLWQILLRRFGDNVHAQTGPIPHLDLAVFDNLIR